jgi:serine/threonine protein kinase
VAVSMGRVVNEAPCSPPDVDALCQNLKIPQEAAMKICKASKSGWRTLVADPEAPIVRQAHNIDHLKIYKLSGNNGLVADYAGLQIQEGTAKRVKEVYRIFSDTFVRLTSLTKGPRHQEHFEKDMVNEAQARKAFVGIPYISDLTTVQYYSNKGVLKTRYLMPRYDADLWYLAVSKLATLESRKVALECCKDIFLCLSEIHNRGYVHGDIKLENVFSMNSHGYLGDFGLFSKKGSAFPVTGTPEYMAPETFLSLEEPVFDPKMDMFSFGIMLFGIVHPDLFGRWKKEVKKIAEGNRRYVELLWKEKFFKDKTAPYLPKDECAQRLKSFAAKKEELGKPFREQYCAAYNQLQNALQSTRSQLIPLILQLIRFDPKDRPTSEEAKKRFAELIS